MLHIVRVMAVYSSTGENSFYRAGLRGARWKRCVDEAGVMGEKGLAEGLILGVFS